MDLKNSKKYRDLNFAFSSETFLLNLFFKCILKKGKGGKALSAYSELCFLLKKKYPQEKPSEIILRALLRIKPIVGLRLKKVAGINYQLPYPISEKRACKMAVHWFYQNLGSRKERLFVDRMLLEILDIIRGKGLSLAKRDALEKTALDNRPFIFFLKR